MKKISIIFLLYISLFCKAQIQVVEGNSSTLPLLKIAQKIVGKGIKISNLSYSGGNLNQMGIFSDNTNSIGFSSGSIFTTGRAILANAPNDQRKAQSNINHLVQDADLLSVFNFSNSSQTIYDQCVLEFDFVAATDSLVINYIFASEEYNEFISTYNDAIGIFLSGPGIVGNKNIAVLEDNSIVSVSTIHQGIANPVSLFDFYWENNKTDICNHCNKFIFNPKNSNITQYDGFTVPLKAKAKIIPCQTYHLKIAIADALDGNIDSGLLIESGGIKSDYITTNFPLIDNTIKLCLNDKKPVLNAHNGFIAYNWFYNQTFTGNTTPNLQTTLAGNYMINITTTGNCVFSDSIKLKTGNEFILSNYSDTLVCSFSTITVGSKVNISDTYTYKWFHSNETKPYSIFMPLETKNYTVSATNLTGCTKYSSVTVSVNPVFYTHNPSVSDLSVCLKNAITVNSNLKATDLLNNEIELPTNISYNWIENKILTINGLNLRVLNPTLVGINTITSKITTPEGCFFEKSINFNTIKKFLSIKLTKDSICVNENSQIITSANGVSFYQWNASNSISNLSIASPFINPKESTTYKLTAYFTNPLGCTAKDSINLKVNPLPIYSKNTDTSLCKNEKYTIKIVSPNNIINWKDSLNLSNIFSRIITKNAKYNFTITSFKNCKITDSIKINSLNNPILKLRNDSTICFGKSIEIFPITFTGNLKWKPDLEIINTTILSQIITPNSSKFYFAEVLNSNGCGAKDSFKINVLELPKPPFIFSNQNFICEIFENYTNLTSSLFKDYIWSNGSKNESILIKNEGFYSLTVTDFNGCQNFETIEIKRNCDGIYKIPNVITPNNDGKNDIFVIDGLVENSKLKIFNRWGIEIFSTENYKNDWQALDIHDGIYFYFFEPKNGGKFYKSSFEIIR